MIIDGFTLFGSWPGLPYDHQAEELVSGLERFKINRACALSSKGIFFDAAAGNETTANVCKAHPSLIPIGVADPRMNGTKHVEYCQAQGFPLLALFPVTQEWAITNISAREVLMAIARAQKPVLIEAGRDGDASAIYEATKELAIPVILHDVSLKTLTEAKSVLHVRPNTFLTTRLLCGGDTIELLVQEFGAERLIFSSRFPISCFSAAYLTAKFANINDAERTNIMGGNMARLLQTNS